MRISPGALVIVSAALALASDESRAAANVTVPMECSRGPSGQSFRTMLTMPAQVVAGEKFTVRVDGVSSGTISHTGLRFIHDMTTEYLLPSGATLVAGSLHLVPGTGTSNVTPTASVAKVGNTIRLTLPGRVDDGSSYTPPSIEFQLEATGAAGNKISFQFSQYRVTAKAVIIGDVDTVCTPKPQPFTLGTTTITAKP